MTITRIGIVVCHVNKRVYPLARSAALHVFLYLVNHLGGLRESGDAKTPHTYVETQAGRGISTLMHSLVVSKDGDEIINTR